MDLAALPRRTHLSLCSGILGLDLAAHWAGFETVATCERDPDCQKVIRRLLPGIPIFDDVKNVTRESIQCRGIGIPDLITAGFPCQPFSVAGSRKGDGDERHLWPEIARILCDLKPRFFVGENVRGLLSISDGAVFGAILRDLASLGYRVGWGCWGADEAAGHTHRRDRVFIFGFLADAPSVGCQELPRRESAASDYSGATKSTGRGMLQSGRTRGHLGESVAIADRRNFVSRSGGELADAQHPERERNRGTRRRWGQFANDGGDVDDTASRQDDERVRRSGDPRRRAGEVTANGCSELAYPEGNGRPGEGRSGWQDGVNRNPSVKLADAQRERRQVSVAGGFSAIEWTRSDIYDFPPGPRDFRAWRELLIRKPYLAPALTSKAEAELGIRPRTDGLSRRMALRMLGNAVDPWQAYPLFQAIAEASR